MYFVGVSFASVFMLYKGLRFVRDFQDDDARGLLHASLFFLPIILCSVFLDSLVLS